MAKLRWRIERDYQVLKDQLGLDHFEGRPRQQGKEAKALRGGSSL
jgi:SRSO17 transposase